MLYKIEEGRTFTLTLSKKAEKKREVIKIKKEWLMVARNYSQMPDRSQSVNWIKMLKVWLYLIARGNTNRPITDSAMSKRLGMSAKSVKNAREALQSDLEAIHSSRVEYIRDPFSENEWICLGRLINVSAWLPSEP